MPRHIHARFIAAGAAVIAVVLTIALGATIRDGAVAPASAGEPDVAMQRLTGLLVRTDGQPAVDELAAFETQNAGTGAAALARFLRGTMAVSAQDWGAAVAAFDAPEIAERTALGDHALFQKGRALVRLGRQQEAERALSRVPVDFPDSIVARDATIEAARAGLASARPRRALELVAGLTETGDGDALALAGDAAAADGDPDSAIRFYRRAWYRDPASAGAATAVTRLNALGISPADWTGSVEEMTSRADRLYGAEQWAAAVEAYGRLLEVVRDSDVRESLHLRRGVAATNARDGVKAEASLALVTNRDPDRHAEALYSLALAVRRSGRIDAFESTGARLRAAYPSSPWTGRHLADLAAYLEDANRLGEMVQIQRALARGFPSYDKAAQASYDLAWNAYRTSDYRGAAELFTEHLATFRTPTTKYVGEAAFWGGKAWERIGNVPRALFLYRLAAERYPYGYHGHVATNRLKDLERRHPKTRAEEPQPGSQLALAREHALAVLPIVETADGRVDGRLRRVADFEALRLWDPVAAELGAAEKLFPTSPRVALRTAQTFRARGDNYQATLALRKGYPDVYSYRDDQMPREAWELIFPLTNWDTIKRQSEANGLDPYMVAGLIRQESVFNPRALSRANARGLMQLLPSTGRLVAKSRGLGSIGPADLYNPTLNITLGTAYLSDQLGRFGRIELAAAAYNAGPGRVVQWKAQRPVEPIEEWIENIPISETRGYVQGVLRYAANYRRFYGGSPDRAAKDL